MAKLELIATATFGLEAVVKRELEQLGCRILRSEDGKITYQGDERTLVRSNLWLRCADRVLLKMGEFKALTFEELFQQTRALPWEEWIPEDGKFTVTATAVKSKLASVPDCQAIVKKAVVERMRETYQRDWFEETGAVYTIKLTLLSDRATLTIDTSGAGLHKRGYRVADVTAPIKETLAAAMVQLSFWKSGRLLLDPFCGSGTIPIEAALIGRNIAPGLSRKFASEEWDAIPKEYWKEERKAAFDAIDQDREVRILASDLDPKAIRAARQNAEEAGVEDCIEFRVAPLQQLTIREERAVIICNPPYGERIGDKAALGPIYQSLASLLQQDPTLSLYVITSDKTIEEALAPRLPDRRRKLYNGRIEVCYYQYYGAKTSATSAGL